MVRAIVLSAIVAIVSLAIALPASAQFASPFHVIPVIAKVAGSQGTDWRSDGSITNLSDQPATVRTVPDPEAEVVLPRIKTDFIDILKATAENRLSDLKVEFDEQTLDRLRNMSPREAFEAAKDAVYRSGAVSSDDFLDAFDTLVEHGVLTREQIDEFMAART